MENEGNKKNEFLKGATLKSEKLLREDYEKTKDPFIEKYMNTLSSRKGIIRTSGGGQFKNTRPLKGNISGLNLCSVTNDSVNNLKNDKSSDNVALNGRSWKHTEIFNNVKLTRRPLHPEADNNEGKNAPEMDTAQNGKTEKFYVCTHCGALSKDSAYCDRCSTPLPRNPKLYYPKIEEKKTYSLSSKQAFYGKKLQEQKYPLRCSKTPDGNNRVSAVRRSAASRYCRKIDHSEPECLTISSDDESDSADKSINNNQEDNNGLSSISSSQESNNSISVNSNAVLHVASENSEKKEMFPMDTAENTTDGDSENHFPPRKHRKIHALENSCLDPAEVSVKCRSIRIGSYKIMPRHPIKITPKGIFFISSSVYDENDMMTIHISTNHIVKILVSFSKVLTVFFVYASPGFAGLIRSRLQMNKSGGPFYDPGSEDETQKRITVLPDKITDNERVIITGMFKSYGEEVLKEIELKAANEILVRSTPDEFPMSVIQSPPANITKLLIYPPPPQRGGITITTDDYSCLEEGQFLNDVIIDFYLKYLVQNKLSEENQKRTHIFSSFFYRRLTQRPLLKHSLTEDPKLSPAENRHSRVKTWTRHVDIFEKDFIIIPINEHAHWFLAVVCFPYLDGPIPFGADTKELKESLNLLSRDKTTETSNASNMSLLESGEEMKNEEPMDIDDVENEEVQGSLLEEEETQESKNNTQNPIKQPCILIFDSLVGPNRGRIIATLREYLKVEWKVKKKSEKTFAKEVLKGAAPKVPQQRNYSDCGIYLLHYVESFFENPIQDFTIPIRNLEEWFTDHEVGKKREQLRTLIRELMFKQHGKNLLPDDDSASVASSQELPNQLAADSKNELVTKSDLQS